MTRTMLNHFRDLYFEKYEQNYPVVWGKDMAIMKRLLKIYDEGTLLEFINGYFQMTDEFVIKAGHPLGLLQSQIPKIVALQRKSKKEPTASDEDADMIEQARNNVSENDGDF